jgi:uncharacterized membrane protein
MDNSKIKNEAKDALEGRWGVAVLACLIFLLASGLQVIPKIGGIFALLLSGPLMVGFSRFSLNIAEGREAKPDDIFYGFKQYGRSLGAMMLMYLYIFLWALLLIIPGIIAALGYAMVPFLLADNESIGIEDALATSKKMMDGYKADLFFLQLSFIGWYLLCLLTVGIGYLWLMPWVHVSTAKFYLQVKADWDAKATGVSATLYA